MLIDISAINIVIQELRPLLMLLIIFLLSAIVVAAELILLQIYISESITIEKWQLVLFLTPFLISSASFFPIMFLRWSQGQNTGTIVFVQKRFFWKVSFGLLFVLLSIMYIFAF